MPTPEKHALLSPSSASRWLRCPPSVRLGENAPESTSEYAEEGRLAHAIAELKARKKFTPLSKRTYDSQLKKLQADPRYQKEMDSCTEAYVEALEGQAMQFKTCPFTALETAVPVGLITGERDADDTNSPATGTADCIQIGEGVLWVNDYKHGKGVAVSAEDNDQMKLYALGALALYAPIYGSSLHTIRMTIIQPRLEGVTTAELTRAELEAWGGDVVAPAAALAMKGAGEMCAGEWCKFCPVKAQCRERANGYLALEAFGFALPEGAAKRAETPRAPLLTDDEVGDVLTRAALLAAWYDDLKNYALTACLSGKEIAGYKVVEGRGSRTWDDLDAAFAELTARGVAEALLWERKPITAPALEKELGKKAFAALAEGHVVKKAGAPTLVPDSDNRPPYNNAAAAFGAAQ